MSKLIEHSKNSSRRKIHSYTSLPQKTIKISYKQSNLTPRETGENDQNNKTANQAQSE